MSELEVAQGDSLLLPVKDAADVGACETQKTAGVMVTKPLLRYVKVSTSMHCMSHLSDGSQQPKAYPGTTVLSLTEQGGEGCRLGQSLGALDLWSPLHFNLWAPWLGE